MMKTLLVAPVLFAAACATDTTYPDQAEAPTTPVATTPIATAGDKLVIATGGTAGFAIADSTSVGLDGDASSGYAVEPAGDVWPNMKAPVYYVRALGGATLGSFEIQTNRGIASGLVESADLATASIVPADYQ